MKNRLFYCTESEKLFTESEMKSFYDTDNGGYDSFAQYINACLVSNNGTLVEIKKEYTIMTANGIIEIWNVKSDI